jgi:hypothetical protein
VLISTTRLAEDVRRLLDGIRGMAQGRYACIIEPGRVLFESADPESEGAWMLRRFLEQHSAAVFALPEAMEAGGPQDDVFGDWEQDEFLLAIINGKVALVVACPEAEALREQVRKPLAALADRLFRYNSSWRYDPRGRGFFFGHPKLDLVVVGRPQE